MDFDKNTRRPEVVIWPYLKMDQAFINIWETETDIELRFDSRVTNRDFCTENRVRLPVNQNADYM